MKYKRIVTIVLALSAIGLATGCDQSSVTSNEPVVTAETEIVPTAPSPSPTDEQEDSADEEPLPLLQRYERPTDFASSIQPLNPEVPLARRYEQPTDFASSIKTLDPAPADDETDPPVRTGPYTDRLCKDLGDYLRCMSFRNDKFTLFCADPETGERMFCPQQGGLRCRAVGNHRREYACWEGGVSWCVYGKPVNGEIYNPEACSYAAREVLRQGEPAVLSPESPNDPSIADPTILWATPSQDGKWVEVGFRDESTVETLFHIEKAEGRCEANYRFTVRFVDMIRSNDTEGTGSTVRHSSPEGTAGYTPGGTYCFRVVARDALGNGSRSAGMDVQMPASLPPSPMHR